MPLTVFNQFRLRSSFADGSRLVDRFLDSEEVPLDDVATADREPDEPAAPVRVEPAGPRAVPALNRPKLPPSTIQGVKFQTKPLSASFDNEFKLWHTRHFPEKVPRGTVSSFFIKKNIYSIRMLKYSCEKLGGWEKWKIAMNLEQYFTEVTLRSMFLDAVHAGC